MAGDVDLDALDAHDFPALAHRVSPWLVSSLIGTSEAFRELALVAYGVLSQKFVVHHPPAPCPLKQGDQEAVLNRVSAGQFPGGPVGLRAGQPARGRFERRPVGEKAPRTARRHLHRAGVLEPLHAARSAPSPEVGPVTVDHPAHRGRYGSAISFERGEQHAPGPLKGSEVAAAGFLLVAAMGCGLAV
jgi:hypothetical protein